MIPPTFSLMTSRYAGSAAPLAPWPPMLTSLPQLSTPQLDASFLQDELLDLPPLDHDTLLALDSSSDAFPDLDLFSGDLETDGNAIDLGGLFDGDAGSLLPGGSSAQTRASPSTSESGAEEAGAARTPAAGLPFSIQNTQRELNREARICGT